MKNCHTLLGWPQRDSRHYRFAVPNAVWKYQLRPAEFVIFSYLCYNYSSSQVGSATPEIIAKGVHMTADTVKKHLTALVNKALVNEDGAPALKCKDEKFFTLPNEIFLLNLPPSAFVVYAYLLLIEDRRTHTCHPSYNTIAAETGLSKNTALKSVEEYSRSCPTAALCTAPATRAALETHPCQTDLRVAARERLRGTKRKAG